MQVAVSRMEYVGQPKSILRCYPVTCSKHLWQTRTGDHCVLDHRIRRDASHCSESTLARCPEFLPFRLIMCKPASPGSVFETNSFDTLCFFIYSNFDPIKFDKQRGANIK